ncbi:hypothetical protein QBC47DRAFT_398949 [Echria macrotheca]|uniref:Uncharacterized protein n=1 Tax=Echria macrotheca TaxID=438768 RepID=A0AAJ0BGW8_9PEZI|nr:hypothetical protein QBC47DRAFT_398949 [Echria macrotheca]
MAPTRPRLQVSLDTFQIHFPSTSTMDSEEFCPTEADVPVLRGARFFFQSPDPLWPGKQPFPVPWTPTPTTCPQPPRPPTPAGNPRPGPLAPRPNVPSPPPTP